MTKFHSPGRGEDHDSGGAAEGTGPEELQTPKLQAEVVRQEYLPRTLAALMGEADLRRDLVETLLGVNERVNAEPLDSFASGELPANVRKLQAIGIFKASCDSAPSTRTALGMTCLHEGVPRQVLEDALSALFNVEPVAATYIATLMTHLSDADTIRIGIGELRTFDAHLATVRAVKMTQGREPSITRRIGLESLVASNRNIAASICGDLFDDGDSRVSSTATRLFKTLQEGDPIYQLDEEAPQLVPLAQMIEESCRVVAAVHAADPEDSDPARAAFDSLSSLDAALGTALEPVVCGWLAFTTDSRAVRDAARGRLKHANREISSAVEKALRS